LNQTDQRVEGKKEALNQRQQLNSLINELADNQGVSASSQERYKQQARIVTDVLANPIARPKDPTTVQFLQNMENALKNGRNPFAYMSPAAKNALLKAINS